MDLATVDKLLTTTRSVRQRLDLTRPVEPEIIERCLEVADQAPTGGNVCRYHFMAVTGEADGCCDHQDPAVPTGRLPPQGHAIFGDAAGAGTLIALHLPDGAAHTCNCIAALADELHVFT
jgi:hypothetical protein